MIDTLIGWNVDLLVRRSRPYSQEEFERRRGISYLGTVIDVVSAEVLMLSKLEWSNKSASERHLRGAESAAMLK